MPALVPCSNSGSMVWGKLAGSVLHMLRPQADAPSSSDEPQAVMPRPSLQDQL